MATYCYKQKQSPPPLAGYYDIYHKHWTGPLQAVFMSWCDHLFQCLTQTCCSLYFWYFKNGSNLQFWAAICVSLSVLCTVYKHDLVCTCIRVFLCLCMRNMSAAGTWYLSQYFACFCQRHCGWFSLMKTVCWSGVLSSLGLFICLSLSSFCVAERNRTPRFAEPVLWVKVKH